jgi:hypothetical protein
MIRRIDDGLIRIELTRIFEHIKGFKVTFWHNENTSHYIHIRIGNRKYTVRFSDHETSRDVSVSYDIRKFDDDLEILAELTTFVRSKLKKKRR